MSGVRDDNMDKTQYKPAAGQQGPGPMDKTQYKPAAGQQGPGPMDKTQYKPAAGQQGPGLMDKTQMIPATQQAAAEALDKTQMIDGKVARPLEQTQMHTSMPPPGVATGDPNQQPAAEATRTEEPQQPVIAAPVAHRRRPRKESTLLDAPSLVDWVVTPNKAKDMHSVPQSLMVMRSRFKPQAPPQPMPTVPNNSDNLNDINATEEGGLQFDSYIKKISDSAGTAPSKDRGLMDHSKDKGLMGLMALIFPFRPGAVQQEASPSPMGATQNDPASRQQEPSHMDKTQYKPASGCMDRTPEALDKTQMLHTAIPDATAVTTGEPNQYPVIGPNVPTTAAQKRKDGEEGTLFDTPSLVDWVVTANRAKDMHSDPQSLMLMKSRLTPQPQLPPTPTAPRDSTEPSMTVETTPSEHDEEVVRFEGDSKRGTQGDIPATNTGFMGLMNLIFPARQPAPPRPKNKTQHKPSARQQGPSHMIPATQQAEAEALDKTQMIDGKVARPLEQTQLLDTEIRAPRETGTVPNQKPILARGKATPTTVTRQRDGEEGTLFEEPSLVDWVVTANKAKDMQSTPQTLMLMKSRLKQQPKPTPTVSTDLDDSNRAKSSSEKAVQFEGDALGAGQDKEKSLKTPPPKD